MEKLSFKNDKNISIIDFLLEKGLSYNTIQKCLRNKDVKVDKQRIKSNIMLKKGEEVEVFYQKFDKEEEIIYQDNNIMIVNKKKGIEIEGENGLAKKVGCFPVHRLDRNTSGLVVFAKTIEIQKELFKVFKNKGITKKYICQVVGCADFDGKIYTAYLLKDAIKSKVQIFEKKVAGSVMIETKFKTLLKNENSSFVECELLTGKTHQIRAHLAFLGFPIVGDGKYGKNCENKKFNEKYQKLHCFYLKFCKMENNLKYLQEKEFFAYPDFFKK